MPSVLIRLNRVFFAVEIIVYFPAAASRILLKNENQVSSRKIYDTYVDKTNEQLINSHADVIFKYFNIFNNAKKCLPSFCWLPKLHKNPTKPRFINAGSKSFVKPFFKSIILF